MSTLQTFVVPGNTARNIKVYFEVQKDEEIFRHVRRLKMIQNSNYSIESIPVV